MAKDAIDNAAFTAKLPRKTSITETLKLHGWISHKDEQDPLHYYGADKAALLQLTQENSEWKELIHPEYPYIKAQIVWAERHEMDMSVEDVLARRIR